MATKEKLPVENFPFIPPVEEPKGVIGPSYGLNASGLGAGAVRTPTIKAAGRAIKAVVGTSKGAGVDFSDIQEAINHVDTLGGGTILLLSGTYYPTSPYINLKSNVYLVGEDPERTIIDCVGMTLTSGQAAMFGGGEQMSIVGTVIATNDSATIAGTSTKFVSHGVKENDVIYINFHPYHVKAVASETSLTIKETYRGATTAATNFAIYRAVGNVLLENFTLLYDLRGNNGGILLAWVEQAIVRKVKVRNFSGQGITIRGVFNFSLENCETYGNTGTGIEVNQVAATDLINNGAIINCLSWSNDNRGINIAGNSMVRVWGCTANGNNLGIRVVSSETHVSGCTSEFNKLDGIRLNDASYCQIIGNNASSNGAEGISTLNTDATTDNNVIVGNNCENNADYGVYISASTTGNKVGPNNYVSNTAGSVKDLGTSSEVYTDKVEGIYQQALINGNFDVWQRGTNFNSNDDTYIADHWIALTETNGAWNFNNDTLPDVPTGVSKYSLMCIQGATNSDQCAVVQILENVDAVKLAGKTVSLSFYAKTTDTDIANLRATILAWTGTADSVTSDVIGTWAGNGTDPTWAANWTAEVAGSNKALTSSWQRFTIEGIVLDTASTNNLAIVILVDDTTISYGDQFYIAAVQLNVGSVAIPFQPKSFEEELQKCKRYFQTYTQPPLRGVVTTAAGGMGRMGMVLPVEMRVAPTPVMGALPVYDGVTTSTVNALTTDFSTTKVIEYDLGAANDLMDGNACVVYQSGTTTLTLDAEL